MQKDARFERIRWSGCNWGDSNREPQLTWA